VPRYLRTSNAQILDRKRTELQAAAAALRQRPAKGWVHALRSALGMSVTVLARRLGVSHSTVLSYEKAELTGRIQIEHPTARCGRAGCRTHRRPSSAPADHRHAARARERDCPAGNERDRTEHATRESGSDSK